mgnify:FL=1
MSNISEFMAALRAERQKQLREQQVLGLNQRTLEQPDTRLLPLPDDPTPLHPANQQPSWINQVNHHMDLPALQAELELESRREKINSTLYGQKQRITLNQILTKRALRRLGHLD